MFDLNDIYSWYLDCKNRACRCVLVQDLHPSEELRHAKAVPIWGILQMLLFPVYEGRTATIVRGLTYPKICPRKKKEREKMATSRDGDRHCCGPGLQKSWWKGKTSGDVTSSEAPHTTQTTNHMKLETKHLFKGESQRSHWLYIIKMPLQKIMELSISSFTATDIPHVT